MQGGLRSMSDKLKITRKLFTPDQYEKEEIYLNEMSMKGYHLVKVKLSFPLPKYYFEKGEPKKYSYQIDYTEKDKIEGYGQLLKDAGWDKVSTLPIFDGEWMYLRKESKLDAEETIFTDQESMINLCKKVRKRWGLYILVMLSCNMLILSNSIMKIFNLEKPFIDFSFEQALVIIIVWALILALYFKIVISLSLKINKLKKNIVGY